MAEQNDLLDEFKLPLVEKNTQYVALLYISAFYIIVVIISFVVNLRNLSFGYEAADWIFLVIIMGPALSGFFISLSRSFIGWFISLLYYSSILGFMVGITAKDFFKGWIGMNYFFTEGYRGLPLLLLPPIIIALLLSKSVRSCMKVSVRLFRVGLIMSLAVGIGLAYLGSTA